MGIPWNSVWLEYDENDNLIEAHYEMLKEKKKVVKKPVKKVAKKPVKRVAKKVAKAPVKRVAKVSPRKTASKKNVSERATFGRLNKILQELGQFVKITEVRHAYRARFHEDLKLTSQTRDRVLVKYDSRYENLVFHRARKLKVG